MWYLMARLPTMLHTVGEMLQVLLKQCLSWSSQTGNITCININTPFCPYLLWFYTFLVIILIILFKCLFLFFCGFLKWMNMLHLLVFVQLTPVRYFRAKAAKIWPHSQQALLHSLLLGVSHWSLFVKGYFNVYLDCVLQQLSFEFRNRYHDLIWWF